jgi:glycosidase
MSKTLASDTDPELRFWITIDGLTAGKEYILQYLVDESLKIADPYADKICDPWNDKYIAPATYPNLIAFPEGKTDGIASVFQTSQNLYNWKNTNFISPKIEDLVIYELLIRDFTSNANYQTMIDTLSYLKSLGINAIELMPINEFDGNDSWGYNPAFYFAPDKAYGTKDKFKEFIDSCHQNGIAVIIDMVLNHSYGQSPLVQLYFDPDAGTYGQPSAQNLWYNQVSPNPAYSWGYDFNHESTYTQQFIDSVNSYWLTYYNVDGFRFDFTKGFTNTIGDGWNYDASRITILKRIYNKIKEVKPNAYIILEHLSANNEETELSDYGMLLWGNMNSKYNEATMGFTNAGNSNISGVSYKQRGWTNPNLVSYMESHDEQRLMYKNITFGNSAGQYNIKNLWTALPRIELAACFFLTVPGPKMIWQFGELGYDVSIDYNDRVGKKPIKWNYYSENDRYRLFQVFSSLIKLKTKYEVFETSDYTLDVNSATKWINLNGADMNVSIIGNFGVTQVEAPLKVQNIGTWYDYFSGNSISVTDVNQLVTLKPGEYHIYTSVKLEKPDIVLDIPKMIKEVNNKVSLKVFPNPAKVTTKLSFKLEENIDDAEISIFNLNGQKIQTLYKGKLTIGERELEWNLKNTNGQKVPAGIYLLKLNASEINGNSIIVVE